VQSIRVRLGVAERVEQLVMGLFVADDVVADNLVLEALGD
jgi:hypothetical protein